MPASYMDRCIKVDLTKGTSEVCEPDKALQRDFVGGKGLGLALLCGSGLAEPFSPANPLIFLTGPLTGTSINTSNRSCAVTRSPLTGGFLDSHAGGHYGTAIKRAGYDYIYIKGAAKSPVYVRVTPKGAEILEASNLWGKGCIETENALQGRHPGSKVASIGPAGEKLVRFACITTEKYRQYGRGGAGAVMGSKNLKAVVVEGKEKINYHNPDEFSNLNKVLLKELMAHPNRQRRYDLGTTMWIRMGQEMGHFLPTRNFKMGEFPGYERLTSETMKNDLGWKSCGCLNCAIQCSKMAKWDGKEVEGPEYETVAYLGSGCEIADAKAVAEANLLCDDLGLDTISAGVTISFAMEAAEKGLLSAEDNRAIKFGSSESLLALVKKIAMREGIGDILAEGTRIASRKIGKGSDYFAIQIAGMEISGVNPLGCYSMALALATSDFASHTRFWSATDEMSGRLALETLPKYTADGQDDVNVRNCLIVCDFLPFGLDRLAPFVEAGTGQKTTREILMAVGERIHALARAYNMRAGRTHADDALPARFHEEEMCAGLLRGKRLTREFFEGQLQEYYRLRGWDEQGRPTNETMERLGIDGLI
ncbi:MAG: aldehyde ferredoxin oxidoreductase family protein [Euryarchaeota archaeon]|nr:aldehyde ferredoxin oxidoreductase family protein [Euryarchaeota archaeon]